MIQIQTSKLWVAPSSLDYVGYCELPTRWGDFKLHGFVDSDTGKEHLALTMGDLTGDEPVLARVHSECLTGDALFSQRCDCGAQLEHALREVGIRIRERQPILVGHCHANRFYLDTKREKLGHLL